MAQTAKRGRPSVAPEDYKKKRDFRASNEEWQRWQEKAQAIGINVSEFLRRAADSYHGE